MMTRHKLKSILEAFVNLYGFIDSENAYLLIKRLFPDFEMEELNKYLIDREDSTHGGPIIYTKKINDVYYIMNCYLYVSTYHHEDEAILSLKKEQEGKEYFLPETYEELIRYKNVNRFDYDNEDRMNRLGQRRRAVVEYIQYHTKVDYKYLVKEFKDEATKEEDFINTVKEMERYSRRYVFKGHTLEELK